MNDDGSLKLKARKAPHGNEDDEKGNLTFYNTRLYPILCQLSELSVVFCNVDHPTRLNIFEETDDQWLTNFKQFLWTPRTSELLVEISLVHR